MSEKVWKPLGMECDAWGYNKTAVSIITAQGFGGIGYKCV